MSKENIQAQKCILINQCNNVLTLQVRENRNSVSLRGRTNNPPEDFFYLLCWHLCAGGAATVGMRVTGANLLFINCQCVLWCLTVNTAPFTGRKYNNDQIIIFKMKIINVGRPQVGLNHRPHGSQPNAPQLTIENLTGGKWNEVKRRKIMFCDLIVHYQHLQVLLFRNTFNFFFILFIFNLEDWFQVTGLSPAFVRN